MVNPAAGGGRCRKLVGPCARSFARGRNQFESGRNQRLRARRRCWSATLTPRAIASLSRSAETGLLTKSSTGFSLRQASEPPTLAFLPLGTGNSFLRDFSDRGVEFAIEALLARRSRPCDVLRLTHDDRCASLHQSAEHGIFRRRGHPARPTFQRLGRDRLSVIHFHQPGAFPAAPVSPASGWRSRRSTGGPACS